MPILGDLYTELMSMDEKEAKRIASALELYVSGSLNVFNHRTNVNIHNRLVCYDIKDLGKQLKKLGMLIVQDQVWNRVTANMKKFYEEHTADLLLHKAAKQAFDDLDVKKLPTVKALNMEYAELLVAKRKPSRSTLTLVPRCVKC